MNVYIDTCFFFSKHFVETERAMPRLMESFFQALPCPREPFTQRLEFGDLQQLGDKVESRIFNHLKSCYFTVENP